MRYLVIQIGSGVILLAGVLLHYHATRSIAFDQLGTGDAFTWPPATWLIFLAFGIKCAFPLLHNWLQDAYPEATVSGAVVLSAFTTKLAVYALARSYAGTEILIVIGAVMALYPIAFALIENDLRRALAYALMSQLGVMVIGLGIGSPIGINGAVAHAVTGILYIGLLYMGVGAVLARTGTAKASELGGVWRSMPRTMVLTVLGAASLAAVPLFAGFASKALVAQAASDKGLLWVWLTLLGASAGGAMAVAVRVPIAVFFARDSGKRPAEAPAPMQLAMLLTAILGVVIGVRSDLLYNALPFPVTYRLLTFDHVMTQVQLVALASLAYAVSARSGVLPDAGRATILDTDWFYRGPVYHALVAAQRVTLGTWHMFTRQVSAGAVIVARMLKRYHNPVDGMFGRAWPTGTMAFWTTLMLGSYLLLFYLNRGF